VHRDGTPVGLAEHLTRWGDLPLPDAAGLVAELDAAGLRGLGGAGFPTARKLAAVASRRRRPIVVANGAEGEPASGKDKVLLRCVPHLVLDGASIVADALGAEEAIVAVGRHAQHEHDALGRALYERRQSRLDRVPLRIAAVPDGFVAGEETAIVNVLNGGPAKPTFVPPRPFERGVRGRPTLVQNVETLANVALVARFGAGWFRALGTTEEPGSVLVTLSGAVERPGVYEAPRGMPLRDLLAQWGGADALQAVLVGGYFGAWLSAAEAQELRLLDSELAAAGSSLGARAIVALPETACGVLETARVARYLASQSAGQCGPCVHGLAAIAGALEGLARRHRGDAAHLPRWLAEVEGRGACAHPDGAARFVSSARRVFAREIELHARGRCSGAGRPVLPVPEARKERG
jgi:NADH:ubiquinone oxidoreductase subunit F (NADH-binding)